MNGIVDGLSVLSGLVNVDNVIPMMIIFEFFIEQEQLLNCLVVYLLLYV